MKKYRVHFKYMSFERYEDVEALDIWGVEKIIKEKYGERNVKIQATASHDNKW